MNEFLEAMAIFQKYIEPGSYQDSHPFHCEHDTLMINVDPTVISREDHDRLAKLGFFFSEEDEMYISFRYGSC